MIFAFTDFTWIAKPYFLNLSTIVRSLNFACALVSMAIYLMYASGVVALSDV